MLKALLDKLRAQNPEAFADIEEAVLVGMPDEQINILLEAKWTSAQVNELPDSCFLLVEEGGTKDDAGKTAPRSLRHFPVKDADGKVDLPHLRNALARIPQSKLSDDLKAKALKKAQALAKENGIETADKTQEAKSAAFGDSLEDRQRAVSCAVREKFKSSTLNDEYVWAEITYDDHVIVSKGQKHFSVNYTIDKNGVVTFTSEPVEVRELPRVFEVVKESVDRALPFGDGYVIGPMVEGATEPDGSKWAIIAVESGMSANRNIYGGPVIEKAAPLYEGVQVYMDHEETPRRFGRSGRDLVGFIQGPSAVSIAHEAKGESKTGVAGTFCVIDKDLRGKMLEAYRLGNPNVYGFSHVVESKHRMVTAADGRPAREVSEIRKVHSVDLVTSPSAGGRVVNLAEAIHSLEEDSRMLEKLLAKLKALNRPDLLEALGENPTEDAVLEAIDKALVKATTPPVTPPATPPAKTELTREAADNAAVATLQEAKAMIAGLQIERDVAQCALPDKLKARLRGRLEARISAGSIPSQAEIVATIKEAVEDYGSLVEANVALPIVPHATVIKDRTTKMQEAWNDFFDPEKPARSVRELYLQTTGDKNFTGRIAEARLMESLDSTSFAQVLGDSITRRLVAAYREQPQADWKLLVSSIVPLSDFRTQRRARFGGYGNLAIVNEGQPYLPMVSPTDEEATYAPAKRGGTEVITLEMIRNDDVGAIREIPRRMARSARQTLLEFVFDLLAANPVVYDGAALLVAGHGNNLLAAAMSAANLNTLRLRMRQQTDMSSGKRLGIPAKNLWVPQELEELAYILTATQNKVDSANNDKNFVAQWGPTPHVVDYWTDTNNYFVTADPNDCPLIEMGFLDGQQEPDLQVQDMPNVGSMFTNDQLTYKLRHIYGGAWLDYRGAAGAIVA